MLLDEPIEYYRHLPHFQHIGATFFVTFRLADSLPQAVILRLQQERDEAIQLVEGEKLSNQEEKDAKTYIKRRYHTQFNEALDTTKMGLHYLKYPDLAQIVVEKLKQYDEKYYYLDAYCVMSNHVHVLLDFSAQIPENAENFNEKAYKQLSRIMKYIKGGTAREINKKLNQTGTFWQEENFDTYIRDDKHRTNVIHYILNNPVKIGLCKDWQEFRYAGLGKRYEDLGL